MLQTMEELTTALTTRLLRIGNNASSVPMQTFV
jgi:hypothetical protein